LEFILLKKYFKRSSLSTEKDEMNRMKKNAGIKTNKTNEKFGGRW
jgi:hypothetical protein